MYMFFALMPAMIATIIADKANPGSTIDYCVTVSGIIAYTIICLQFVLTARVARIEKSFGFPAMLRFHKIMAVVAAMLVFLHILLLVISRGNWDLVLFPFASWPIQVGRFAVVCFAALLVISFGRRWIPVHEADWRWFHNSLAWLILSSGFLHSTFTGSSFENLIFAVIWTGYLVVAVLAWSWRNFGRDSNVANPSSDEIG